MVMQIEPYKNDISPVCCVYLRVCRRVIPHRLLRPPFQLDSAINGRHRKYGKCKEEFCPWDRFASAELPAVVREQKPAHAVEECSEV